MNPVIYALVWTMPDGEQGFFSYATREGAEKRMKMLFRHYPALKSARVVRYVPEGSRATRTPKSAKPGTAKAIAARYA
jgi:hypothetical protein